MAQREIAENGKEKKMERGTRNPGRNEMTHHCHQLQRHLRLIWLFTEEKEKE